MATGGILLSARSAPLGLGLCSDSRDDAWDAARTFSTEGPGAQGPGIPRWVPSTTGATGTTIVPRLPLVTTSATGTTSTTGATSTTSGTSGASTTSTRGGPGKLPPIGRQWFR